ncbi:hypothetical protein CVT24_010743 [Panaeolus cyanescens]|uniref:DUF6533 domain-containing protein n=1 Tax=Panaeolus cyanescens TaxID=181874 RepID=A0A409YME8_9AGAR|nr:hypothetical protein CVT24_010743 [Panaeolus cyanescens]
MVFGSILEKRSLQQDVFTRNVSSIAALVVLIWEFFDGVQDERRFIWRGQFNKVKGIYLFARYFGICAQIANTYLVFGPLSEVPVPRQKCQMWFIYLSTCSTVFFAATDLVLMLRVYVLYNRNRKVGCFLFCLLALQAGLVINCGARTIKVVPFDGICDVQTTPVEVVCFMTSAIVTQLTLLLMTVAKRKVASGQSPVIHVVVRDGTWVFALMFGMVATTIPYSLFVQISKPHIVLVWPITILSFACCRLILNMQKLGLHVEAPHRTTRGDRELESTGIAFTSFIDTFTTTPDSSGTHRDSRGSSQYIFDG